MKSSLLYPVNSVSRRFFSLDGMWRFQFDPEWNVHASYLYKIVIRIADGEDVIDEYYDKIGIRTFESLPLDYKSS